MSIFLKLIYKFSAMPIKIPTGLFFFFLEINKLILNFLLKYEENRISKPFCKKNKTGGFTLPDFKTYHKATAIMIAYMAKG